MICILNTVSTISKLCKLGSSWVACWRNRAHTCSISWQRLVSSHWICECSE